MTAVKTGFSFIILAFLYAYFYQHINWLEHRVILLVGFGIAGLVVIGSQVIIYYLGIRRYADSHFYIKDSILYHEWKNGKNIWLDLATVNHQDSDLEKGNLIGHNLYMHLPKGIDERDDLLKEIHKTVEIYGDNSTKVKTSLERFRESRILPRAAAFIVLTQVGGLIYLLNHYLSKKVGLRGFKKPALLIAAYLVFTLLIVPGLAPLFGRSALPATGSLRPLSYITILLNRHYVQSELKTQLIDASESLKGQYPDTPIRYLDANFPFISGFPLLPHLSHNDGKKVDLAFFYQDKHTGMPTENTPSFIGYGVYEAPEKEETNYPGRCRNQGYWQYSILGALVPQWKAGDYRVDAKRTRALLEILMTQKETSKIFIEPHLKERWGLSNYEKIRFHGCRAVRHDDHIHLQVD